MVEQKNITLFKPMILIVDILFFSCIFLLYILYFQKEVIILSQKPLLITTGLLLLFYESIGWVIGKYNITKRESFVTIIIMIHICWIFGIFFFLAGTSTIETLKHDLTVRLCIAVSHILYITGWVLILFMLCRGLNEIADQLSFTKAGVLSLGATILAVGLVIYFDQFIAEGEYIAPNITSRFHSSPLFVLIEILYCFIAFLFFIGVFSRRRIGLSFVLASILLIFIFSFFVTSGSLFLNRMKYDFIFFGPFWLSIVISVKQIINRFYHLRLIRPGQNRFFLPIQ